MPARRKTRQETNMETARLGVHRKNALVDATDMLIEARSANALTLRMMGKTYDQIAHQVGLKTASGAYKLVKAARRKLITESINEVRDMQAMRIEYAINEVMDAIRDWQPKDKLWAVDRLTPLMKRQADLLGLDAASNKDVNLSGQVLIRRYDADVEAV